MEYKKSFRLPDGSYTYDIDTYSKVWFSLANEFLNILGDKWCHSACDPDLIFEQREGDPYRVTDRLVISSELAKELIKKFKL